MNAPMFLVKVLVMWTCFGIYTIHANHNTVNSVTPSDHYRRTHNGLVIPIMIHLDKVLVKRLTAKTKYKLKEKFKYATEMILSDVEKIYKHRSLNISLNLRVIDVKLLKYRINRIAMDENVSKYLKSYCEWQSVMKTKRGRWWYSILFTGLDLFYMDGFGREVRRSTGYIGKKMSILIINVSVGTSLGIHCCFILSRGYMNGMCSQKNSCTLLEWQSKNVAYILAHEIAHSLGVYHDGPPHNECKGRRYIMDALYSPHSPAKAWSPCNKRDLINFLTSKHAWCLRPEGRNVII